MKHVSVPFDKKLFHLYQRQYRKSGRNNNAFAIASIGTQLAGMGLNAWLASKQAEAAASLKQSEWNHEESLQNARFAAEAAMQREHDDREAAAQDARDQRHFEAAHQEIQGKATFEAFKEGLNHVRLAAAAHGMTSLYTPEEQEHLAQAAEANARASGRIGSGDHIDPSTIPHGLVKRHMDAAAKMGMPYQSEEDAAYDYAHSTAAGRQSYELAALRGEAAQKVADLKVALANAKSVTEQQRIRAQLEIAAANAAAFLPQNEDGSLDTQTTDAYAEHLAGRVGPGPQPIVPGPQPDLTAPDGLPVNGPPAYQPPSPQAPASAGRPLPPEAINDIRSLPPEHQLRAIQGFQQRGFDVSPLQQQAAPAAPATAPATAPAAPGVAPASQPTGMAAPPNLFHPREMAAMYSAAQQKGIPPHVIDAEIAQNPWGVRQALDQHVQGYLGAAQQQATPTPPGAVS